MNMYACALLRMYSWVGCTREHTRSALDTCHTPICISSTLILAAPASVLTTCLTLTAQLLTHTANLPPQAAAGTLPPHIQNPATPCSSALCMVPAYALQQQLTIEGVTWPAQPAAAPLAPANPS